MIIPVKTPAGGYDIVLERGALANAAEYLPADKKAFVVTDDGVPGKWVRMVTQSLPQAAVHVFPQGEGSKNLTTWQGILQAMLAADMTRRDAVVAVGGGVAGDMAGFAAACYMRGIPFINIPTTLLSQVDSSIGGKTAVDFEGTKNIVGAFYQPQRVIIDPDVLGTLPARHVAAGLAEALKMAFIYDKKLFEDMEKAGAAAMKDPDLLQEIIRGSLLIKRDVVEQDVLEKGLRKCLNFGHTLGHAVEAAAGGTLLHGECVAMGMIPLTAPALRPRLKKALAAYGLQTDIPYTAADLRPYLVHDKKRGAGTITAVCVEEVGRFVLREMTPEELLALL